MSCDNIQGNGDVARRCFTAFATPARPRARRPGSPTRSRFPNCMVDRITPVTTDEDRAEVASRFGIDDAWPVVCEPFTQWVLEDDFAAGRPPYEDAGVQLVDGRRAVRADEAAAAQCQPPGASRYFGYLAGYRLVHEAAQDPLFARVPAGLHGRRGHADAGAGARHRPRPLQARADRALLQRRRCATRSPGCARRAPTASRSGCCRSSAHNLAAGGEIRRSAAVVASWARYAEGIDEQGEPIEVVDRLRETADRGRPPAARRPAGIPPQPRRLRRPRGRRPVHHCVPLGARVAAHQGCTRDSGEPAYRDGPGVGERLAQKVLPRSRAEACADWRPASASGVARLGRKCTVRMSSMPAQRSQSSKYGCWKSVAERRRRGPGRRRRWCR